VVEPQSRKKTKNSCFFAAVRLCVKILAATVSRLLPGATSGTLSRRRPRAPRLEDRREDIRLARVPLEVRIALAPVVVDPSRLEEIAILHKELDRRRPRLRRLDRVMEQLRA